MKLFPLFLALILPFSAQAYGTRDWLSANQHFSNEVRHPGYVRGYNYLSGGRRTTVQSEQDRTSWSYEGNYRSPTAPGTYHWQRRISR